MGVRRFMLGVPAPQEVAGGRLDLEALGDVDDDQARRLLLAIPGIGRWSAEYTLLRGLGRLHVRPGDDVGARNNLARRFGLAPTAGNDEVSALVGAGQLDTPGEVA